MKTTGIVLGHCQVLVFVRVVLWVKHFGPRRVAALYEFWSPDSFLTLVFTVGFGERSRTWIFKVLFKGHSHVDLWENKRRRWCFLHVSLTKYDFYVRLHLTNTPIFFVQLSFSHGFVFTNKTFNSTIFCSPNLEPRHFRKCTEQKNAGPVWQSVGGRFHRSSALTFPWAHSPANSSTSSSRMTALHNQPVA